MPLRQEGDGEERAKNAGDGGDTKCGSTTSCRSYTRAGGGGTFAVPGGSVGSRSGGDSGEASVQGRRLVCHAVGRRGDDWSIWGVDIARVRLGIGLRNAIANINSDRDLEIRITNFKGTFLGVVGHVVLASNFVVNILTVGILIGTGTGGITDSETELV